MIYTYRYLTHKIEQFHENIAYFFEQLFVLNPAIFDADMLFRTDFAPLIKASRVTLLDRFTSIVMAYHSLNAADQQRVQEAFRNNNDIEIMCACGCQPYKYEELPDGIRAHLKELFLSLWERYPQNQQVSDKYGTVKAHFDDFVSHKHQQALLCPFCGIHTLQPSGGDYRDAYDHFIPKAVYPFNSVNFRNLVPICYDCNSNAKKAKDVPFDEQGKPRRITYPYATQPGRHVEAHINYRPTYRQDDQTLLSDAKTTWYITLTESGQPTSEMDSWNAIYNIRNRYQDHVGQFERQWWKEMFKRYKRNRYHSFAEFRFDILDDYEDVTAIPMGILRKAYYQHLFATPNIEVLLNETMSPT